MRKASSQRSERSLRAVNPKHEAGGWVDRFLLGASRTLIRLHWPQFCLYKMGVIALSPQRCRKDFLS